MFIGRDDRKCNSRTLREPGYSAVGGGEVTFHDKPRHFIQAYESIHRGMRSLREMAVIQSDRHLGNRQNHNYQYLRQDREPRSREFKWEGMDRLQKPTTRGNRV